MGILILILGFKGLKERTEEQQGLTLIVHFIELSIKKELTEFIQTILLVPLGEYLSKSVCLFVLSRNPFQHVGLHRE